MRVPRLPGGYGVSRRGMSFIHIFTFQLRRHIAHEAAVRICHRSRFLRGRRQEASARTPPVVHAPYNSCEPSSAQ